MQELAKADIFFFITSVAVVVLTVGVIIALFYIIRILRSVRDISDRVDEGSKALAEDLTEMRGKLKIGGFAWKHIFAFIGKRSRWIPSKKKRNDEKTD